MSAFETVVLIGLGMIFLAIGVVGSAIEKASRHLSNIADRLLDIQKILGGERP